MRERWTICATLATLYNVAAVCGYGCVQRDHSETRRGVHEPAVPSSFNPRQLMRRQRAHSELPNDALLSLALCRRCHATCKVTALPELSYQGRSRALVPFFAIALSPPGPAPYPLDRVFSQPPPIPHPDLILFTLNSHSSHHQSTSTRPTHHAWFGCCPRSTNNGGGARSTTKPGTPARRDGVR